MLPITDNGYFQADKYSQSDIAQHVYFVAIFIRSLIVKDRFSLFTVVALLQQQLTVHGSGKSNLENAT